MRFISVFIFLLLFSVNVLAAINTNAVWEIRKTCTAGNVNGGAFVTGSSGTDFSQQDAAQAVIIDGTCAGAGNTVGTTAAAASWVGNVVKTIGGSNVNAGIWLEAQSVVAGTSVTFGTSAASTSICTGASANVQFNLGGCMSLEAADDDDVFDASTNSAAIMYAKAGASCYTFGEAITAPGGASAMLVRKLIGYNTTRGDNPNGVSLSRPCFNSGTNPVNIGGFDWHIGFAEFTSSATVLSATLQGLTRSKIFYTKVTNTNVTITPGSAISLGANGVLDNVEAVAWRGTAVDLASSASVTSSYIHDSNTGISAALTAQGIEITDTVFRNNYANSIISTTAIVGRVEIKNNTFVGVNQVGTGISFSSASAGGAHIKNNIFYRLATGISRAGTANSGLDSNNNWFGNTADVTVWVKGTPNYAFNPNFGVSEVSNTGAGISGTTFTDSSKNFTALGVVAGRDFFRHISGSCTAGGSCGITAITAVGTTTLTLAAAPGDGSAEAYIIGVGANFAIGPNLRERGNPGIFPGGYSQGYLSIGAVQPRKPNSIGNFFGF